MSLCTNTVCPEFLRKILFFKVNAQRLSLQTSALKSSSFVASNISNSNTSSNVSSQAAGGVALGAKIEVEIELGGWLGEGVVVDGGGVDM